MVAPGRVELPTFGLGNRCSIHLSYGAKVNLPHYLTAIFDRQDGARPAQGFGSQVVESEIQFEHVDSRFAEEPQVALVGVLLDQVANRGFRKAALPSDARNLKLRGCRGDLGIQARGGGGEEIDGIELRGILFMQGLGVGLNAVDQFLVGGSEVGAAGVGGVVSVAGG